MGLERDIHPAELDEVRSFAEELGVQADDNVTLRVVQNADGSRYIRFTKN
jgi:hypothetical protein